MRLLSATETAGPRLVGLVTNGKNKKPKRYRTVNGQNKLKKNTKAYKVAQADVQRALKTWECTINAVNTDPAPITVENLVDLEGPPANYEYISDYKAGDGVQLSDDPIVGCECATGCFAEKKKCCPAAAGTEFPYYRWGRIRVGPGCPVYECNRRCSCSKECPNRVVQKGRQHKVCIFRTADGRGWGIKTLQKIKAGSFVMEYLGEVCIMTTPTSPPSSLPSLSMLSAT